MNRAAAFSLQEWLGSVMMVSLPPKDVILDGESLTLESLVSIANPNSRVSISEESRERIRNGRAVVDSIVEQNLTVYGITTGFGNFANVSISSENLAALQVNLIRSHCCGVGDPLTLSCSRLLLALRINVLCKGHSGITIENVDRLVAALNANVIPRIPLKGSVGASGDLAPLAHLALGLMGEGVVWDPMEESWKPADEVLHRMQLTPLVLGPKEGLALINGTQFICALGAEALFRAYRCALQADIICALSLEALRGSSRPFDPRVHRIRPHRGQIEVARRIRALLLCSDEVGSGRLSGIGLSGRDIRSEAIRSSQLAHGSYVDKVERQYSQHSIESSSSSCSDEVCSHHECASVDQTHSSSDHCLHVLPTKNCERRGSKIMQSHTACGRVQDAYSLRCTPQVHGIVHDTLDFVRGLLETEINSATDNPLVFDNGEDENGHRIGDIVSAGNFHGEVVAKAMDYLGIAVHELSNISEKRTERLVNHHLSGLPPFLVRDGGLNSGFMMAHVTVCSLVSENKVLVHPSSADTIPTSAGQEDHVSMGPTAARKALEIVSNVEYVLAVELLCACQGIDFLRPLESTPALEAVYNMVRNQISFYDHDRVLSSDIELATQLIRSNAVWDAANTVLDLATVDIDFD